MAGLAKAADVEIWLAEYTAFLDDLVVFGQEAGHTDGMRLDPASLEAVAMFDKVNTGDLGMETYGKSPTADLLKQLGKLYH